MIIYSLVLGCLDPVVTIASILSVKDLFILPFRKDENQIIDIKMKFAQDSLSDHQMLLNLFDEWKKQVQKFNMNFVPKTPFQMERWKQFKVYAY